MSLDGLPTAHLQVLLDGLPVFERYGLLLAGGYAFRAHEIRKDIGTVQGDQVTLSNAGLPGTPGAGAAVSAAQAAIRSAIATANGYIDHVNGDLRAACAAADSVGTGACAGDGPGKPPSGVDHLK